MKLVNYTVKKFFSSILICAIILSAGLAATLVRMSSLEAAVSDWQQGMSIYPNSSTDFGSENYKASIRAMKRLGLSHVTLIVPYYQKERDDSDIHAGANTPSDDALTNAINYAHSQGLKVMLKPHLDLEFRMWRAYIKAKDRDAWYRSYSSMLNHLGDIAERTNVEGICIGTELITMASFDENPDNTQALDKNDQLFALALSWFLNVRCKRWS
jgi:hypothetical protein